MSDEKSPLPRDPVLAYIDEEARRCAVYREYAGEYEDLVVEANGLRSDAEHVWLERGRCPSALRRICFRLVEDEPNLTVRGNTRLNKINRLTEDLVPKMHEARVDLIAAEIENHPDSLRLS